MYNIAIILFPGTNCEYETLRAVKKAGMEGRFFRWNEDYELLNDFDGYIIPGGFSYEDRIRSGVVAAKDRIMKHIKYQAQKGKSVLGICNGAQILVESGMIPGLENYSIDISLARNNKGYLNKWVYIKNCAPSGRCVFNNFDEGHYFALPIAHGEGRFEISKDLLEFLIKNNQTVFRYCDENGEIQNNFPTNPNGTVYNLAGVCNKEGNVLAFMPHPERVPEGQVVFESMVSGINLGTSDTLPWSLPHTAVIRSGVRRLVRHPQVMKRSDARRPSIEILVDLKITDNEAQTLQIMLKQLGFEGIKAKRWTHWEISTDDTDNSFIKKLIDSGEILNTNKEIPCVNNHESLDMSRHHLLVRDKEDFVGEKVCKTLKNRLGLNQIQNIKKGVVWELDCSDEDWDKILKSFLLFNPHSENAYAFEYADAYA